MKRFPTISLLVAVLVFAPSAAFAQAAADRVRIEARVVSEQDRKDIKGSTADTVTQHKSLHIIVSGKPKTPETRTGKWTVYGRDLGDKDITVIESGDFKVDLPPSGPQKIESKRVSTTSTAAHSVGGGGNRSKSKKVDGKGAKYAGYGVIVKDGDVVVGELFDPVGIKQEAAK